MNHHLDLQPYLDRLRELPFAERVDVRDEQAHDGDLVPDAIVHIRTGKGQIEKFAAEKKNTLFPRALTNALIAEHQQFVEKIKIPLLVFAPYIPRETGERLLEAGVNFADLVGNVNLKIGNDYHALKLGLRKPGKETPAAGPGPATTQLEFILLTVPEATKWPVRELANAAGIGKTFAARIRKRLVDKKLITTKAIRDRKRLEEDFIAGYEQFLRPRVVIDTYRAFETDQKVFTARLAKELDQAGIRWALTGTAGAYEMDGFYRGDTTALFVQEFPLEIQKKLRLVPDTRGQVTLLRMFTERLIWKTEPMPVAHPLLVYAELLHNGGPRDMEAAELIRERHLAK